MDFLKAKPMSRKDIRTIAKRVRVMCNVPIDMAFPIVDVMENFLSGLDEDDYVLEITDSHELGSKYALTIPEKKVVKVRQDVYEEACKGDPHHLFTLAHELGHAILHKDTTVSFARDTEIIKHCERPEWQANTFAGELIAPADEVKGMTEDEVVSKYKCSYKVAQIQLEQSLKI